MSFSGNSNVVNKTDTQTITGDKNFKGGLIIPAGTLISKQGLPYEGGEIVFEKSDESTLANSPFIDCFQDWLRILNCNALIVPYSTTNGSAIATKNIVIDPTNEKYAYEFGNGLILEFGTAKTWSSNTSTITFPIPIPHVYAAVCSYNHNGTISDAYGHCNIGNRSGTGMTVYRQTSDNVFWAVLGE